MTLAEQIIKGIDEAEFDINPELQKKQAWPAPEVVDSHKISTTKGHAAWAMMLEWPNGRTAQAMEIHETQGAELNIWAPLSTIELGEWGRAVRSIAGSNQFNFNRIYVYIPTSTGPLAEEIKELSGKSFQGGLTGYQPIDEYESPDDDEVTHHFIPDAESMKTYVDMAKAGEVSKSVHPPEVEPEFGDGAAMLAAWVQATVAGRVWVEVMKPGQEVTSYNPVMIMVGHIGDGVPVEDNKKMIEGYLDGLEMETFWASSMKAFKMWPKVDQGDRDFSEEVESVMLFVDRSIEKHEGDRNDVVPDDDGPGFDKTDGPLLLSAGNLFEINKRSWITIAKNEEPVTSENYVQILVNNIPIEGDTTDKKDAVYDKLEELRFAVWWNAGIDSWLIAPVKAHNVVSFNKMINALMSRIDELIYAEPKEVYQVWVDHPNWQGPTKHHADFGTAEDALAAAKAWHKQVQGPGNANKSAAYKSKYSWKVTDKSGTLWGEG